MPNLRNYLVSNNFNCCCVFKLSHTKENQSTQTSISDNSSLNGSNNALNVPLSDRSLHHQLTRDSGIDINSSKSKTSSYSSTPIDPNDLAMISSSTRNNSIDRQDSIVNEQKTIINEILKENDVLEKSSQNYDDELSKYNILTENNSNSIEPPPSALKKRRLFKGNYSLIPRDYFKKI